MKNRKVSLSESIVALSVFAVLTFFDHFDLSDLSLMWSSIARWWNGFQ